jgi:hypothetical protein
LCEFFAQGGLEAKFVEQGGTQFNNQAMRLLNRLPDERLGGSDGLGNGGEIGGNGGLAHFEVDAEARQELP